MPTNLRKQQQETTEMNDVSRVQENGGLHYSSDEIITTLQNYANLLPKLIAQREVHKNE